MELRESEDDEINVAKSNQKLDSVNLNTPRIGRIRYPTTHQGLYLKVQNHRYSSITSSFRDILLCRFPARNSSLDVVA